jgi:hypothetical protein
MVSLAYPGPIPLPKTCTFTFHFQKRWLRVKMKEHVCMSVSYPGRYIEHTVRIGMSAAGKVSG